jgi:multiple antibiotic resistance protein
MIESTDIGPCRVWLTFRHRTVLPLASPLLVGPGTMATLIVPGGTKSRINVLISAVTLVVVTGLILRSSSAIGRPLGKNGLRATSRLLSIVLAPIAAQMTHGALLAWGAPHV